MNCSKEMHSYFDEIELKLKKGYSVSELARAKGYDPEEKVDIPIAKEISERVEGLVSAVAPQILKSGVAERIKALELEFGTLDWRVALKIAEEVAKQKFCKFDSNLLAMETGIRVGLAYVTLGVIAAPLEGFIELKIKKRRDGKEYLSCLYAGPIRAAGGTAEAVSLVIADYVRLKMGYEKYDPSETEIKRIVTEIRDYHDYASNLQYLPSEEEIVFLVKNLPVEINGDPTEEREVSNYKDLDRIETNRIRGGLCLVLAEGLAQKAPKVAKQLNKWGTSLGLEWDFLKEYLAIQKAIKAKGKVDDKSREDKITPNFTYIKDLVAGRPVLSLPLRRGGFRLRYGRTRTTGLAGAAIHPATMQILNRYIATGTQIKVERPGKAAAISPCDYIDGPIIRLKSGTVVQLESEQQAKELRSEIEKILYLGDILVNYGDFSENNHKLVPPGYCEEWWVQELEKSAAALFGSADANKISEMIKAPPGLVDAVLSDPIKAKVTAGQAFAISAAFNIPLHPGFTYFWKALGKDELHGLAQWMRTAKADPATGMPQKLVLQYLPERKAALDKIGIPHLIVGKEFVVIEKDHAGAIFRMLCNGKQEEEIEKIFSASEDVLPILEGISGAVIRDKGGTFIGARMGRPEKAKMRKLTGSPHALFPVGEEGGKMRSIQSALSIGKIKADYPARKCLACRKETIYSICETCGEKTIQLYYCRKCGLIEKKCGHEPETHYTRDINIKAYFEKALAMAKDTIYPDMIKGVRGTSNKNHVPEHLLKGILRAKNGIYVNKDGTTRYDMIEMPITHFRPREIGTPIETLLSLGYTHDTHGVPLTDKNQVLELKPQDLILPSCPDSPDEMSEDVLFRIAQFVDELLEKLYGQPHYYNLASKKDLVGHLVVGLAPHTSAGILGRIIGFSKTQGMFAHPLYHAAMRRNCDGDESCVILLMDCLLNFSRSFLPDKRGSRTMDAPLVLTTLLIPSEVDSEVHGLDIVWKYPLEFYDVASQYKPTSEIKIAQLNSVLGTDRQYEKMGYTHETTDINSGVLCSAYKLLPSMEEKLMGQMDLAEKISAVDASEVAQLVIEKHLLKDIKGNLRKFSTQQFRCVNCNVKYRRPPLSGKCNKCGGKIIFTISEGSIVKYLEPTLSLAEKYNVTPYLKQTLELVRRRIEAALGKEKERQEGLGRWFG